MTNLDLDQEEKEDKEEPRSADFLKIKAADVIRLRHCRHIHRNIIDDDLEPDCQENLSNRRRRSSSSVMLRD